MLVFHPGELTRRYIHGERARFVSPLALFLFSVFLMFATIHTFDGELEVPNRLAATAKQIAEHGQADRGGQAAKLKQAEADHAHKPSGIPDGDLIAARSILRSLQVARDTMAPGKDGKSGGTLRR